MYREIHNGYFVTGNHANKGREYHVYQVPETVKACPDLQCAIDLANRLPEGSAKPELKPEPPKVEPPAEKPEPKAEAKPAKKKKKVRSK